MVADQGPRECIVEMRKQVNPITAEIVDVIRRAKGGSGGAGQNYHNGGVGVDTSPFAAKMAGDDFVDGLGDRLASGWPLSSARLW